MTADALARLLGHSPALEQVRRSVTSLLAHGSPRLPALLIEGETGTGKGLLARALHGASPRGNAPFIDVNCAAIPESLLETELFGYAAGAFSSARRAKPGLITLAHGGTLFLDELGALPLALQAKLLTAVEEQNVRPLGGTRAQPVDVWVLSATSEGLEAAVGSGRFRRDLYHRLARLSLKLPPLRERGPDVLLLARHFLARAAREHGVAVKTLALDAGTALQAYSWPGNVRELANLMERLTLLADGPTITAAMLELPGPSASARSAGTAGGDPGPSQEPSPPRRRELPPAAPRRRTGPMDSAVPPVESGWRLRRVTVLRSEPTAQALDSPALVARWRAVVRDKVGAFGGIVEAADVTGLLAYFGLEPSEDAPVRAAHAAMAAVAALRRVLDGISPLIVGIDVLEGRVGERGHRGVLDPEDVQSVCGRLRAMLRQAQPGDVVASAAALAHLERAFDDAPLAEAGGAVRLVRARGAFAATTRRTPSTLVGRNRELAWLTRQVHQLEAGQGRAIGLIGDPGAGKSRLLHELHRFAASLGVPWLEGRCVAHGAATPYLPLVDLLRRSAGVEEADDPAAALGGRLQQAGLDPEHDSAFVERLLGLPGGGRLARLSPETIRTKTFDVLRRLIQPGPGPTVMAIEDLHWIDRTSEAFLASLVDAMPAAPLLLIVTYRTRYAPPWIDRSSATQLPVRPLDPAASRAIVSDILKTRRIDEAPAERLVQQAEGNPFFLEELAWNVGSTEGSAAGVPRTIRDVISARIERLPAGPQRLLETASVVGREAPARLLDAVVDNRDSLAVDLDVLITYGLIHEVRGVRGVVYAFQHALTQEVAYDRVSPAEKRRLHAAAERHIERMHAGSLDSALTELTHHAVCAENWERAYSYLRACSLRAIRASAFLEAAQLLEQALDTLRHLPASTQRDVQHFETSLELWTACWESGQYARIPELERQIEPLAHALGQQPQLAGYIVRRAQRLWGQVKPQEVVATVAEALQLAAPADVRTRSYAYFLAGSACRDLGTFDEALQHLQAGARLFEAIGPDHQDGRLVLPILVNIDAWRSEIHAVRGNHHDACAIATRALALARSIGDDSAVIFAKAFLGQTLLLRGDLAQALPVLEQAVSTLAPGRFANATFFAAAVLAYALALAGKHARALELLDNDFPLPSSGVGPMQRTRYRTLTTAANLTAGRPDEALRELDFVLPIARRAGARGHLPTLLRLRAESLLRYASPDLQDIQTLSQEAHGIAASVGLAPEVARCLAVLGRAEIRAGKVDSGRTHLEAARGLLRDLGMDYWLQQLDMEMEHDRRR